MHGELATAVCELMKTTLGLLPVPRGGDGDGGGGGVGAADRDRLGDWCRGPRPRCGLRCGGGAWAPEWGDELLRDERCLATAHAARSAAPQLLRLDAAGAAGATAEELQASVLAHARQALERVAEAPPPALDEALKVASFILNHLRGFCVSYGPWAAAEAATGSQAARELGTGLGRLLALLPPACVHGDAVQEAMPKLEKLRASVEISMQELLTGAAVGGQRVGGVPHILGVARGAPARVGSHRAACVAVGASAWRAGQRGRSKRFHGARAAQLVGAQAVAVQPRSSRIGRCRVRNPPHRCDRFPPRISARAAGRVRTSCHAKYAWPPAAPRRRLKHRRCRAAARACHRASTRLPHPGDSRVRLALGDAHRRGRAVALSGGDAAGG